MWSVRVARVARIAWGVVARGGLIVGAGALAGCGLALPWSGAPQQNCVAGRQGTLGPAGGVIVPLAARDPTDTAHKVSEIYAINGSDGSIAWNCASTTFYGWDDVQMTGGVVYALAGTEEARRGGVTRAHAIYAIRPNDGKQFWSYSFVAGVASPLAFGGGMIFTTTETGDSSSGPPGHHPAGGSPPAAQWGLLAIHADSGALAWSAPLSGESSQPVTAAGHVIVALNNGGAEWSLQAYDGATGAVAWAYQLSNGAADFVTLDARDGILYAEVDQSLIAIDGATGQARWTRVLIGEPNGQTFITPGSFILSTDGGVEALDLASGAPRWNAAFSQRPQIAGVVGQTVYLSTMTANDTPNQFYALDIATGQTRWSQDVAKLQSLSLEPGLNGAVYLTEPTRAQLDESVIALDGNGGARWRFDGQSPYNGGHILASGDHLYYIWQAPIGVDGVNQADITSVTCLSASDGATRWQMSLPGVNGDPVEPLLAG